MMPAGQKIFMKPIKFVDETCENKNGKYVIPIRDSFKTWIWDVSTEEIQIGLKMRRIGKLMQDISDTKRGLPWQSKLSGSGDVPVVGGKQIVRYGTNGVKGFVNSEDLEPPEDSDSPNEKVEFFTTAEGDVTEHYSTYYGTKATYQN